MCIQSYIHFHPIVYRQNNITKSERLNVTSNGTIVLQCKFDGIKLEMIKWFRNGVYVDFMVRAYLAEPPCGNFYATILYK